MSDDCDLLVGRWQHVPEEDTETAQVFRPSSHPLPASRGRGQLAFFPDHTAKAAGIGSNDVSHVIGGQWSGTITQDDPLEVTFDDGRGPSRIELADDGGAVLKLIRRR